MRVFLRVHTLRDPDAFGSFVVSVGLHVIRWHLRRRRVRKILQFVESVPEIGVPGLNLDARRNLRRFYDLLDGLPAEERLVLGLRNIEGMSLSEIAGRLGVSASTAKRRLFKATTRMSKQVSRDPALAAYSPGLAGNLE